MQTEREAHFELMRARGRAAYPDHVAMSRFIDSLKVDMERVATSDPYARRAPSSPP